MSLHREEQIITRLLHSDRRGGSEHNAVHKPLHIASQYAFSSAQDLIDAFGARPTYAYSRQGTPTGSALEQKITLLEQAHGTVCFATGMAALSAVFMGLLRTGDHLISSQFVFGNTNSLLGTLVNLGIQVTMVDTTDIQAVQHALRPNTRMIFSEVIGNPVTQVSDIGAIGQLCQVHGIPFVLDSTMASPYLIKGRDVGASLVVHSLSKLLCGHANALGGSVSDTGLFDWSAFPNIAESYRQGNPRQWGLIQLKKKALRDMGGTLSAESAHRIAAGMETLFLRLPRMNDNALALAQHFQAHPAIQTVYYPGLTSHPQHQRAQALFGGRGYGSLLSIELKPAYDIRRFIDHLQVIIPTTHLGDNRSLCIPVAQTIYAEMGPVKRRDMGISDRLLRFSIGIEALSDLVADIEGALLASRESV